LEVIGLLNKAMDEDNPERLKCPLADRWAVLERNQFAVENLCLAAILAGALLAILRSQKGSKNKKIKKKAVTARFNFLVPKFNQMVDDLLLYGDKLKEMYQQNYQAYSEQVDEDLLVDTFSSLSVNLPDLLTKEKQNLGDQIKTSYASQQQQMSVIIEDKIKYIKPLKI